MHTYSAQFSFRAYLDQELGCCVVMRTNLWMRVVCMCARVCVFMCICECVVACVCVPCSIMCVKSGSLNFFGNTSPYKWRRGKTKKATQEIKNRKNVLFPFLFLQIVVSQDILLGGWQADHFHNNYKQNVLQLVLPQTHGKKCKAPSKEPFSLCFSTL